MWNIDICLWAAVVVQLHDNITKVYPIIYCKKQIKYLRNKNCCHEKNFPDFKNVPLLIFYHSKFKQLLLGVAVSLSVSLGKNDVCSVCDETPCRCNVIFCACERWLYNSFLRNYEHTSILLQSSRLDILKVLSKSLNLSDDVNLEEIVENTEGYSGADLQSILYNAQLSTVEHSLLSENNKVRLS